MIIDKHRRRTVAMPDLIEKSLRFKVNAAVNSTVFKNFDYPKSILYIYIIKLTTISAELEKSEITF